MEMLCGSIVAAVIFFAGRSVKGLKKERKEMREARLAREAEERKAHYQRHHKVEAAMK